MRMRSDVGVQKNRGRRDRRETDPIPGAPNARTGFLRAETAAPKAPPQPLFNHLLLLFIIADMYCVPRSLVTYENVRDSSRC